MRKVLIGSIAAAMMAGIEVRAQHEGEEIDLTPRKIRPPPDLGPIYLPAPRQDHKDKSKALARMLKNKGRK
jgi:hypothetical protein